MNSKHIRGLKLKCVSVIEQVNEYIRFSKYLRFISNIAVCSRYSSLWTNQQLGPLALSDVKLPKPVSSYYLSWHIIYTCHGYKHEKLETQFIISCIQ